jgi:drug/metabolite transporter (DMT)-like permease
VRKNKEFFKGIIFVVIGASSYGVLATVVKLAYNNGYSTTEVTVSQYLLGLMAVGLLTIVNNNTKPGISTVKTNKSSILKLIIGGTTYGLTGVCYYLSIKYIPVSVAIILLMQTIWMGVLLEGFLTRKPPEKEKFIALALILTGTFLATNAIDNIYELNPKGIAWGGMAALMYTVSLMVANRVSVHLPVYNRSFWILLGASLAVIIIGYLNICGIFNFSIFWKWGIVLASFGTVLPPILLNKGMPKTGIGLGSVLIAIEIPVSVSTAHFLLDEKVLISQWLGIGIIIGSIVMINLSNLSAELSKGEISVNSEK